ncbi:MAG TPA: hypothetical protein VM243_13610 [Phycisphaerae bacterium]|nr:hypothetical protein [Phycisphaerae bacterium]
MQLDPTTLDVIDKIRGAGYAVSLKYDKQLFVVTAKDAAGQTWTARGADAHAAIMDLAGILGVELGDG